MATYCACNSQYGSCSCNGQICSCNCNYCTSQSITCTCNCNNCVKNINNSVTTLPWVDDSQGLEYGERIFKYVLEDIRRIITELHNKRINTTYVGSNTYIADINWTNYTTEYIKSATWTDIKNNINNMCNARAENSGFNPLSSLSFNADDFIKANNIISIRYRLTIMASECYCNCNRTNAYNCTNNVYSNVCNCNCNYTTCICNAHIVECGCHTYRR